MERIVSVSQPTVDSADVRAFVRVVDLGSVTAAAKALGETKGSVSRRISRLERTIGLPLLDRTGRRVAPTEDGLVFRQKAGPAVDLLDDAVTTVQDLRGVPTGHLRITAPVGLGTMLLGPVLGTFAEQYPQVTVEIVVTDAVLSFGQDRIDLALRMSAGLPDSSLVAYKLFDLDARAVASPAYVARHGAPEHPSELQDHRLLTVPIRGTAMPMRFAPVDGGSTLDLVLHGHVLTHDLLLLQEAALAGAGVGFLMAHVARDHVASGRLVEVMPGWRAVGPAALYLLTAGGAIPSKTRVFRDFLREAVRRCP